jgi:hypothetical protein
VQPDSSRIVKQMSRTCFVKVTNEGIVIKALLLSTLIAFTLAITPAWGVSEIPTAKPSAAKKHKVTKKHKVNRQLEAAKTPLVVSAPQIVPQASINPYMPVATPTMAAPVVTVPTVPLAVLVPPLHAPPVNPYLQHIPVPPVVTNQPQGVFFPAIAKTPSGESIPAAISFLPNGIGKPPEVPTFDDISAQLKNLVPIQLLALLPVNNGESHWPIAFKTVHPTGAKPLWVLTLKCPTEAAFGLTTPPVKVVHVILTTVMDGINSTAVLPVDLQQVCM